MDRTYKAGDILKLNNGFVAKILFVEGNNHVVKRIDVINDELKILDRKYIETGFIVEDDLIRVSKSGFIKAITNMFENSMDANVDFNNTAIRSEFIQCLIDILDVTA